MLNELAASLDTEDTAGLVDKLSAAKIISAISTMPSSKKPLQEALRTNDAQAISRAIEEAWEQTQALRDSRADSYEQYGTLIHNSEVDNRIVTIISEGRVTAEVVAAVANNVHNGKLAQRDWPKRLLDELNLAIQARGVEMLVGLIPTKAKELARSR